MNRGTCSKNDAVVKFKTNFKLSEHHFDDCVCDGCFVCSCSLNLWRIR